MNRILILTAFLLTVLTKYLEAQIFPPQEVIGGDTCIFDITCDNVSIDTNQNNNLWQIGKPSKLIIDTAFIGIRAIITDSLNSYDTNNISSFTLQLVHPGTRMHELIFWHKYETDEGKDGGYIEMSFDLGETWTNIIDYWNYPLHYQYIYTDNFYNSDDSVFGGNIGFNGSSNDWLKSSISFDALTIGGPIDDKVNQDTTLLRFNFISDSIQDNLDGWCIDNIIHLLYETYDVVQTMQRDNSVLLYPNPTFDLIHIESQIPLSAIEIYNMVGCRLARIDNPSEDIPIGYLPQGIYTVVFHSNNQIITTKKLLKL